eukprot:100341_1
MTKIIFSSVIICILTIIHANNETIQSPNTSTPIVLSEWYETTQFYIHFGRLFTRQYLYILVWHPCTPHCIYYCRIRLIYLIDPRHFYFSCYYFFCWRNNWDLDHTVDITMYIWTKVQHQNHIDKILYIYLHINNITTSITIPSECISDKIPTEIISVNIPSECISGNIPSECISDKIPTVIITVKPTYSGNNCKISPMIITPSIKQMNKIIKHTYT